MKLDEVEFGKLVKCTALRDLDRMTLPSYFIENEWRQISIIGYITGIFPGDNMVYVSILKDDTEFTACFFLNEIEEYDPRAAPIQLTRNKT